MTPAAHLVALLIVAGGPKGPPPQAYSADEVTVSKGVTTHGHIWTDGVRTKRQSDDGTSGSYQDDEKSLYWYWDKSGCTQKPPAGGPIPDRTEVPVGSETIDGHPTRKFKVTATAVFTGGRTETWVNYQWRATDLGDLVIRSQALDGGYARRLQNVRMGRPDPKRLSRPDACTYDETIDTASYLPRAPGGRRTVSFRDASCKQLIALPLTMAIPSDYAIRSGGSRGCFWGTPDDLERVLANPEDADFTSVRRGVFWCRLSLSTVFDPVHERFVSEDGPQERWPEALKAAGAEHVTLTPVKVGGIATLRASAVMGGQRVYMLYVGFGDSPAVLINYHPAGKGAPADDAAWRQFLDSFQATK